MPQSQEESSQCISQYVSEVMAIQQEKFLAQNEAPPDYGQVSRNLQGLLLATRHYIKDPLTHRQMHTFDPNSIQFKTL